MSFLDKRGQIIMQCEATNFKDRVVFFEGVNLFGRNPAKTRVTIKDRSISQIHGKIICKNNTIKLVDTKSKNGIYLNSLQNQIEPDTQVQINPKEDVVYFAQIKCKFILDQQKKENQEETKQFIGKTFKSNPKSTPIEINKQSLQQADKSKNISTKNKASIPQNLDSKDVKKTKKQQEQQQKEREKQKQKQREKQMEKEKEKKQQQKKIQAQEQKKRKEKEKNQQKKEQKKKGKKQSKQKPSKSNEKQENNVKIQSKQISENEQIPNYLPKNKKKPNKQEPLKQPVEKPKQSKQNKETKQKKVQKKSGVMEEKGNEEEKQVKKQKQKRGDSGQTKIKLKPKRKNKSLGKIEQIKKQQKLIGRKKAAEQLNQSFASHSRRSVIHKIALISGFTMTFKPTVKITISENWREKFDVLVMDKFSRTFKLLYAICLGIPVVSLNWILQSEYRRGIAPFQRFYLQSPEKDQISSSVSLAKSGNKVFQNMKFFLVETSQLTFHLPIEQIEALLQAGGGMVLKKTIKRQYNIKDIIFLVKIKYDNEQMKALKKFEGAQKIYTIQLVLESCFYQKIDWDKNKVTRL